MGDRKMTELITDKCPCCGTRGLNPKKIKDMCENCLESSFDQWRRKVISLEEENEQLKKDNKICEEIIIGKQQEINELKKHRDKLLKNSVVDLQKIDELKAQIEKMKCCYNCKYGRIYFVKEIIVDCLANKVNPNNKYENCDKWELAE